MATCTTCGQEIRQSGPPPDRVFVKIAAKNKFSELCRTLRDMTEDVKFRAALYDLPKAVEKYGQLTEGQYKFFAVIHSKCTGGWPSREDFQVEAPPATYSDIVDDGNDIPF